MGRDERRRRRRGGRRAARGPGHQQLRALPRRRHPVRVAAGAGAATAARQHLRDGAARAAAPALAPRREGALDLLVWRGAGPERTGRAGADCQP